MVRKKICHNFCKMTQHISPLVFVRKAIIVVRKKICHNFCKMTRHISPLVFVRKAIIVACEKVWISIAGISKTPACSGRSTLNPHRRGFAYATNNKGFSRPPITMDRKKIERNFSGMTRYIPYLFVFFAFATPVKTAWSSSATEVLDEDGQLLVTEDKLKEQEQQCIESANSYILHTTKGCANMSENNAKSVCSNIALTENYNFENEKFYQSVENKLSGRQTCIQNKKQGFIEQYKEQCVAQINEANKIKKNKILLCLPEATRSQPGCEEWCAQQAEEDATFYDNAAPKDIASGYHNSLVSRGGLDDTTQEIDQVYADMLGYPTHMNIKVQAQLNKQFDGSGELQQGASFSWWQCVKGNNMACEAELEEALETAINTCAELRSEALECCHAPEKCVGGGLASALDSLGKTYMGVQSMKGRKAACDAISATYGMYGGMQGLMGRQCTSKADNCSQSCSAEVGKVVKAFKYACNYNPRTGKKRYNAEEYTCDEEFFTEYIKQYKMGYSTDGEQISIANVPKQCERTGKEANRYIQNMGTNAATSLMAGMKACGIDPTKPPPPKQRKKIPIGDLKEKPPITVQMKPAGCPPLCANTQGGTNNNGTPPPIPFDGPPKGGGGDTSTKTPNPFGDPTTTMPANPFDQDPPDMGDPKATTTPPPASGMGGLIGSGSSGGGGSAGLGGDGGGSGGGEGEDEDQEGDRRPSDFKKNQILTGYHGGKFGGYGGGGNARSGRNRAGPRRKGKNANKRGLAKLNLKKLLPKGKHKNHKAGKFGSPHDDIFQRMSDRIQWMCRTSQIPCNK